MKFSITEYAKCPPVTEMEKSARLVDGIVNNTPFHSSIRCRHKSFTSCTFSDRFDVPDFVA